MVNSQDILINPVYQNAFDNKQRIQYIYGGAGSGKSEYAGQKLLKRILEEKKHRFLLIRKVHKTIKRSQFQLIKDLIYSSNLINGFKINESECSFKYLNDNEIISCGLDDVEKLKSIKGITGIWIEEATELTKDDFSQINLRLRGKTENYKQIILTFNPINHLHWLNNYQFNDYYKLQTTYKDNLFIDSEYIKVLESLKDQNPEMYKIYALGEWGVKLELIYIPFEKLNEYPDTFEETIYGLDFGYNNQTALIEINIKDKCYYLKELLYETKLTNTDLIEKLKTIIINKSSYIYCDCAEPQRIEELKRAGFNVKPSDKSVKAGIDFCKSQKIYSNYDNTNLNDEVNTYCWKKNKDGNLLDDPVKFNDHLLDALRYGVYTHSKGSVPNIRIL